MKDRGDSRQNIVLRIGLWAVAAYVVGEQLWWRLQGEVPRALATYRRAAAWWADGKSPYSTVFMDAGGHSVPFVYPPGTLPGFWPMAWIPEVALSVVWLIAGIAALVWTALYFRDQFAPQMPRVFAVAAVAIFFPAYLTLMSGSLSIVFGPLAVIAHRLGDDPSTSTRLAGGFMIGVSLTLNPFWALALSSVMLAEKQWSAVGAAGVGIGAVLVGSVIVSTNLDSAVFWPWLRFVASGEGLYGPAWPASGNYVVGGSLMLVWLVAVGWWVSRHSPSVDILFLVGLTSVVVWPSVASWHYLILLPVLFYVAGRRGWRWGAIALTAASTPVIWVCQQASIAPYSQWILYGWAVILSGVVWWDISRDIGGRCHCQ